MGHAWLTGYVQEDLYHSNSMAVAYQATGGEELPAVKREFLLPF